MKVIVHYIRHGQSYANIVPGINGLIKDPEITEKGRLKTIEKAKTLPKVDIVCCSDLLRAKQTAYYSFPDKYIYIVPQVSELGIGLDNMPNDETTQLDKFEIYKFIKVTNETFEEFINDKIKDKEVLRIALFTHRNYIKQKTGVWCKNNEYITKTFYKG